MNFFSKSYEPHILGRELLTLYSIRIILFRLPSSSKISFHKLNFLKINVIQVSMYICIELCKTSTSEFVLLSDRKSNYDVVQFQFTQWLLTDHLTTTTPLLHGCWLKCLPSDALLQHLPSHLGFSCLGRGVSLHGCSSKAQPLLLTLDEGYLLMASPPDLEHGVAPLCLPAPVQQLLLGGGVAPLSRRPWPRAWGSSSWARPLTPAVW